MDSSPDVAASEAPSEKPERRSDESALHDGESAAKPLSSEDSGTSFRLKLPRSEAFLGRRLPEKVPGRYARWGEQTSIHVGQSHLTHASFVDDARTILAQSSMEGSVRVYDRKSRRLVNKYDLSAHEDPTPTLLPWDPLPGSSPGAPSLFALATSKGVDLHEVRTGTLVDRLIDGRISEMSLSADKSILMAKGSGTDGRDVLSFYLRESDSSLTLLGTLSMIERLDAWDLSRDNRLLAVTHYPSDDFVVYDLWTGDSVARLKAPQYTASVAFSPDGRWVAAGGKGLLLVDLVNPTRRAFFSHLYNNINTVRFSPSGDAIAASSYDGHIRLFEYDGAGPTLELLRSLRHTGRANVYRIQFDEEGNSLVSGSGDQTVRVFGASYRPTSRSPESDEFRTLSKWEETVPDAERRAPATSEPPLRFGRYHPPSLASPARPCRIDPGKYACRVTTMYKLRDCTVRKTPEGHTLLAFHDGNLLELDGVLYDDGPVVRYEAWETNTGSVISCDGCERQPIHAVFRGNGGNFSGLLLYRPYYDAYRPPPLPAPDVKIEEAEDRFPLTLQYKSPLPHAQAPHPTSGARGGAPIDPRLLPIP